MWPDCRQAVVQITGRTAGKAKRPLYGSRVQIRAVDWDDPAGVALRTAQRLEIAARYGRTDTEPGTPPSAADIAWFVVVCAEDGTPLGCGALRRLDAVTGEVKRMYVVPERRGTGVATAVLEALEDRARTLGWTHLRLETGDGQPDAVRFYTRQGYGPIPCFGAYADEPSSRRFQRAL
jgi:GNAT superfamily N-acetyltransferase